MSKKSKILTTNETAEYLDIKPESVITLVRRKKIITLGRNQFDAESVEHYAKTRNILKSNSSKLSAMRRSRATFNHHTPISVRAERKQEIMDLLYIEILNFFVANGYAPVYKDLSSRIDLAPSGITRYSRMLIEADRVELCGFRLYPKGLADKIRDLVKNEYLQGKTQTHSSTDNAE